jgi:hypothetical protein
MSKLDKIGTVVGGGYAIQKSTKDELDNLNTTLDQIAGTPLQGRKSVAKPVNRDFNKGMGAGEPQDDRKVISIGRQRNAVLEMMDQMTFKNGQIVNQEMCKAMQGFESHGGINDINIAKSIENEFGVKLVN